MVDKLRLNVRGILGNKENKTDGVAVELWESVNLPVYLKLNRTLRGGRVRGAEGKRFQSTGSSSFIDHTLQQHRWVKCLGWAVCVYPPQACFSRFFCTPATSTLTSRQSFGRYGPLFYRTSETDSIMRLLGSVAMRAGLRAARKHLRTFFLSRSLTRTLARLFSTTASTDFPVQMSQLSK